METKTKFDLVIGLTALKAAGKDEFGNPLEAHGFKTYRVSDAVREECAERGENNPLIKMLQDVGDQMRRDSGDNGYWAGRVLKMAEKDGCRRVIVNGIRNPAEISRLESEANAHGFQFILVGIVAPIMTRLDRYMKRGQAGDTLAMEAFLQMDDRDRGVCQSLDGQQVDRCLACVAEENICINDRTLEDFHNWAVEFAQKYLD